MKVAFLGFVSSIESYVDKKSGEKIVNASIASTNQMMKVRIQDEDEYVELDQVIVAGDIKVYERNFYIENPVMRLSTAEDRLFMSGRPVPSLGEAGVLAGHGTPSDLVKNAASKKEVVNA